MGDGASPLTRCGIDHVEIGGVERLLPRMKLAACTLATILRALI
jgi:hypothetical protein